MRLPGLSFSGWRALPPEAAARELHRRVEAAFSPGQRRAVVALLRGEADLARAFASAAGRGPLSGVPFFLKDMYPAAGEPMRAGSSFLAEARPAPERDGVLVAQWRAAGAVLAGRANMHEFAYGLTGENPHYGDCEHPGFPGRTTGGSSSGSAALVAAGVVPLAAGSDTGGSTRLPAAFCGLFGLRLTPGHPWISDAFPLAVTLDTPGWFTARADDMAETLGAFLPVPGAGAGPPRGAWLELPGLDPGVSRAFREAAALLAPEAGGGLRDELLRDFAGAEETYNAIGIAEAWSVHEPWALRYRERYDPAVWQRLVRADGLSGARRRAGRSALAAMRALWERYFESHDFLVLPASPCSALTKAECTAGNRSRILSLQAPASLAGRPVLTLPVALPDGLSTGLQVVVADACSPALRWALARWVMPGR